jgi:hypothetical protein
VVLGDALTPLSPLRIANGCPPPIIMIQCVPRQCTKSLLDKLTTDCQRIIGFIVPPPGVGFVERSGSSYRFVRA